MIQRIWKMVKPQQQLEGMGSRVLCEAAGPSSIWAEPSLSTDGWSGWLVTAWVASVKTAARYQGLTSG